MLSATVCLIRDFNWLDLMGLSDKAQTMHSNDWQLICCHVISERAASSEARMCLLKAAPPQL